MGATKRISEIYTQALFFENSKQSNCTKFITTRFGNVLGSNGSVVQLFTKQIEAGGPITLTHPEVTRYFMTIPEACQLVLEAGTMGKGGEIFLFDMGESIKILDLATKMIQLSGLKPHEDIAIKYVGLRPGEKLYEELLSDASISMPTHHHKILIAKEERYHFEEIQNKVDQLIGSVKALNTVNTLKIIKNLVPEYQTPDFYNNKL
jgi:FlaA1/EpsC-like NDP-sugar epimerase